MANFRSAALMVAISIFASSAAAQTLTCQGANTAGCEKFHFHIRGWSPETKNTFELTGVNSFATAEACEAERARQEQANAAAIGYLIAKAPRMKAQANKYGPCHCDMTEVQTNPAYLDTMKRVSQQRLDQQTRSELLMELEDKELPSDSEIAAGITLAPSRMHVAAAERHKTIPTATGSRLLGPATMKETTVSAVARDGNWQNELKLVEVSIPRTAEGAPPVVISSAQSTFIASETARVREIVLTAAQGDAADKGVILQAAAGRMQLLSKLDRLIQAAGPESPLAKGAVSAMEHAGARRSFIALLFGGEAADHWAPANPADMAFDVPSTISTDPVAVLRDSSGRFNSEQQKLAFYAFLLQNPLVESDEPWLSSLANSYLQETP